MSRLLVASLLSGLVFAAGAKPAAEVAERGNDVDHVAFGDGPNTVLRAIEPATAPVERRAEHRASDGTRREEWVGQSVLHFRGACIDGEPQGLDRASRSTRDGGVDDGLTCVGENAREDGAFFLSAPAAGGEFIVSWRPVNDSLRTLRVSIAGLLIEGESPIRVQIAGLDAGEHAISAQPMVGSFDQVVDWTASLVVGVPFDTLESRGRSSYEARVGCALGECAPLTLHASDTIIVPWRAHGALTASWDPRDGHMRVSVPGTGFVVEGETPLVIDLSGLTAGEWSVQVEPAGIAPPLSGASVGWLAQLVRA